MHASRRLFVLLFSVISSCGPAPEGDPEGGPDTLVVAVEPQPEARADEIDQLTNAKVAGFGGSRFVIFDSLDGAVVFDAAKGAAFRVPGHPIGRPSDDGRTILVRTVSGVRAINLTEPGAALAS